MAKPLVIEYTTNAANATKAVTAVIARLGYALKGVDKENGLVTFETGMSMNSYAGQSMSVHIMEVTPNTVQITIGGKRNAHGAQMQVYDWNEAGKISTKIFDALEPMLGQGRILAGEADRGACFIATAIYGDYYHPSVYILRKFRDEKLKPHFLGRAFVSLYYITGPKMSRIVTSAGFLKVITKSILDVIVRALRP